jgi:hypothetical protein
MHTIQLILPLYLIDHSFIFLTSKNFCANPNCLKTEATRPEEKREQPHEDVCYKTRSTKPGSRSGLIGSLPNAIRHVSIEVSAAKGNKLRKTNKPPSHSIADRRSALSDAEAARGSFNLRRKEIVGRRRASGSCLIAPILHY